jgi:hypothetical protein
MFRGNHPARVDEKGRLKIPADFKSRVDEIYDKRFYITSKDGKRAEIYPLKEWEKIEEKLAQIPSMNPAKQKFLDITSYYGQMAPAVVARVGQGYRRGCGLRQADVSRGSEPRGLQGADGAAYRG